jgi:transposase
MGAGLFGGGALLQLSPQSRIFLAPDPVDCRKGIAGRAAVCRQRLGDNPLAGAVSVFRNRSGPSLTLLLYDGQGDWLWMKRLSQGRFAWWPHSADARGSLSARARIILPWNGPPERAQRAQDWRRVAEGEARLEASAQGSPAAGAENTSCRCSCSATR